MAVATSGKEVVDPDEPKADETPRDRFVRLCELRVSNVLDATRKLGLLGNKSQYEYTDADIEKIKSALEKSMTAALGALKSGKPTQSSFTL
jgi:hypothetical protein